MNTIDFVRSAVQDIQRGFQTELEPLTQDQIIYRPTTEANTIAFLAWHMTNSWDGFAHRAVLNKPLLWTADGWMEKFAFKEGMSSGNMTPEQIGAFNPTKDLLFSYSQRVHQVLMEALGTLTEADLDKAPNPERPTMTFGRNVSNLVLGHAFWHLGDIRFLKGMQGMPWGR